MISVTITLLLEGMLTRLKGRPFTIDRRIPLRMFLMTLIRRGVWLARGILRTTLLQGRPALVFIGPRVNLRNAGLCTFARGVTLETGVVIDGLSTGGMHLGQNVSIGAYSQLRASMLSDLGAGLHIGNNSSCDAFSFLGAAGGVSIGENVIMGQHVSFHAENHNFADTETPIRMQGVTRTGIRIEDDCWIGSNAVFLDGCVVGRGCVVAAGAVVRGKIEPYSIIGGVPAKTIGSRLSQSPRARAEVDAPPVAAKIGVVTVTFNSESVLDGFLTSLSGQTHENFLLYVVDNASKDRSLEKLEIWGDPRLRLIANATNAGIAEANNQGTRAALDDGCDFVLYLNNDIEFEPETLATLLAEIDALRCDLIAPKVLFGDGVRIWSVGGMFDPLKGYFAFHTGYTEVDRGQFDRARLVHHAPTCCLLVRKGVFERIGLMDPKYFVYWDDTDFSFRAWRAGLRMFYTPRARILHKVSSLTGGETSPFTVRYNVRGQVYFMLKNLGLLHCLFYLPLLELRLWYKLLSRSIDRPGFRIRQRAFFEGMSVWAR